MRLYYFRHIRKSLAAPGLLDFPSTFTVFLQCFLEVCYQLHFADEELRQIE